MKYKCIIFDFDGTLADTTTGIVCTFQQTFKEMGIPSPSVDKLKSTIGLTLKDGFQAAMEGLTEQQADTCVSTYRRLFDIIAIPCTTLYPGIAETLARLKNDGYMLTIATSRSHRSLNILSEKLGIKDCFSGFYGAEDVINHKPAPDLVNLILSTHGLSPEDVLVVGDAHYDMLMGQGAGCKVCGVTWGNQSREQLSSVSPDYIIDDIKELFDII